MADRLLNDGDDGGDDGNIFVYTGGEQQVPPDVKRAKIDESIDTIPWGAFLNCTQLIELEGHNKLKKIENSAFNCCYYLRRIMKMNGVREIGDLAFHKCQALCDLEFDKLEIIGRHTFVACRTLRSINLPSIRRIGTGAFYNCTALTEAVFGEDLEEIEEVVFQTSFQCSALRRIAMPLKDNLIVSIRSFDGCDSLVRIDVVGGINKIISFLHLESWRDDMREVIESINQTLPDTRSSEKSVIIQRWIRFVIDRMGHYKADHQELLKEAMTLLELALWKANLDENECNGITSQEGVRSTRRQVKRARKERCITSGASIIIKNVLPFLQLS
jgi:hypothetical protein